MSDDEKPVVDLVVGKCYRVEHKTAKNGGGYESDIETNKTRFGKLTATNILTQFDGKRYTITKPDTKNFYNIDCPSSGGRRSRRTKKKCRSYRRSYRRSRKN